MTGLARMTMLALPVFAGLAAWPAMASEAPTARPRTEMAATDPQLDPDAIRCKRIEVTGSRIPYKRVCRSNAEWDRMARVGNEAARDVIERAQAIVNPQ